MARQDAAFPVSPHITAVRAFIEHERKMLYMYLKGDHRDKRVYAADCALSSLDEIEKRLNEAEAGKP